MQLANLRVIGVFVGLLAMTMVVTNSQRTSARDLTVSDSYDQVRVVWKSTTIEASRSLQTFVDSHGFTELQLAVNSTNDDVVFSVYIHDPQVFG